MKRARADLVLLVALVVVGFLWRILVRESGLGVVFI